MIRAMDTPRDRAIDALTQIGALGEADAERFEDELWDDDEAEPAGMRSRSPVCDVSCGRWAR
jgi:hypothetical protein